MATSRMRQAPFNKYANVQDHNIGSTHVTATIIHALLSHGVVQPKAPYHVTSVWLEYRGAVGKACPYVRDAMSGVNAQLSRAANGSISFSHSSFNNAYLNASISHVVA